jgi:2-desacetyl-2-hydroxyethyl bacteriochlorophyllide A dehydrogenase
MKAFALSAVKELRPAILPEPQVGPRDVLLEIHYIGLCGTDLNAYRGLMPLVKLPRVPGHEVGGVVIEKGSEVPDSIKMGARATVSPYTNCGACPSCRSGRPNSCEFNETLGVQRDGALTERIAVPFDRIFPSERLSLQELALVEPFSVGYHGANRGGVRETDTVLILGCGTIGMGALLAAVRKGASVIAVDIDDSKLAQAQKFGASKTVNSASDSALSRIRELTDGDGPSVVIEAAGTQATYQLAVEAVSFSGRVVLIGYPKGAVSVDAPLLVRKEVDIYGSRNALRVFPAVISMFERRERPFAELVTQTFPFDEVPQALAFWDQNPGQVSKILIDVRAGR